MTKPCDFCPQNAQRQRSFGRSSGAGNGGGRCVWWMLSLIAVVGREKAALALRVQVRLLGKAILGEDASSIKGAGMNRSA